MSKYRLYTLVFARNGGRILLGMKKRGFGEGRWNGFGGKVDPGETVRAAASRELGEECGLETEPQHLAARARLDFHFEGEPVSMRVFVFDAKSYEGAPRESDEMRPEWFDEKAPPYATMWPDDAHWLPHLLADRCFVGDFWFRGHDTILRQELRITDETEVQRLIQNDDP